MQVRCDCYLATENKEHGAAGRVAIGTITCRDWALEKFLIHTALK